MEAIMPIYAFLNPLLVEALYKYLQVRQFVKNNPIELLLNFDVFVIHTNKLETWAVWSDFATISVDFVWSWTRAFIIIEKNPIKRETGEKGHFCTLILSRA